MYLRQYPIATGVLNLIADSATAPDSLFQTKAGRTVVGGGGITPDLIIKDEGSYPLAASILRSGGYFKFVQENNVELLPVSPSFLNLMILSETYTKYLLRNQEGGQT